MVKEDVLYSISIHGVEMEQEKNAIQFVWYQKEENTKWEKETRLFKGEYLEHCFVATEDVMLVGSGDKDLSHVTTLKEFSAKCGKLCRNYGIETALFDGEFLIKEVGEEAIATWVEGFCLGFYEENTYKTGEKEQKSVEVLIKGVESGVLEQQIALGENLFEAVVFARKLVNAPANRLKPEDFAKEVCEFAMSAGIETEVIHVEELRKKGMDGLLAVGDSSDNPPCFTILRYRGDKESDDVIGLAGKGVTFDTGGYCLKPAGSMAGSRGDMGGGACVAGAIYALAKQQANVNVTAVIPMCENRISGGSMLVGDVISSYGGKSIEIGNTDAEGRLILADAVAYLVKDEKVSKVLDVATLTGAVVSALGFSIAGVLCDNEPLFEEFLEASKCSGEKYWRLPYGEEHEKMIESKVADLRNMGGPVCGTITAGLFIRSFVEGKPWIHLDIAGTAWVDTPIYEYQKQYATGFGVETIYYWLAKK